MLMHYFIQGLLLLQQSFIKTFFLSNFIPVDFMSFSVPLTFAHAYHVLYIFCIIETWTLNRSRSQLIFKLVLNFYVNHKVENKISVRKQIQITFMKLNLS